MNNLAKAVKTNTSRRNRRCLIDQIDSLEHSLMMMLGKKGKSKKDIDGMPEELKQKFLTFYAHLYLLRNEYENYLVDKPVPLKKGLPVADRSCTPRILALRDLKSKNVELEQKGLKELGYSLLRKYSNSCPEHLAAAPEPWGNRPQKATDPRKLSADYRDETHLESTDLEEISKIYEARDKLNVIRGTNWENNRKEMMVVDHIVPLSLGGAHHQDNLQLITLSENSKKANNYDPKWGGVWSDTELARTSKRTLGINEDIIFMKNEN